VQTPSLKITFLGTGTSSGVPMIGCQCEVCQSTDKKDTRLRSSILVQSNITTIVVDTTPDFRYQMLRAGVTRLDAVLYTHPHKDHIAGLDDIRAFNFFTEQAMDIYANELTSRAIKTEFSYIFSDKKYPGIPEVAMHNIPHEPFVIGDIEIIPINVWHLNMPVLAFRFGNFTYVTDANRIEPVEMEKIKGSDIIVLNALRQKKHISHFNLGEAIAVSDESGASETYFTHISHQLGKHADINAQLPPGKALAYDMQVIST